MLNRKRITILALLLLVIGVIGALMTYQSFADSEPVTEEIIFNETITDIIVESDNSKIEFIPSAEESAKVEFLYDTSNKSRYKFEAAVENGELKVKLKEKILQFFNFDFNLKSFAIKIHLPEQTYESITAKTVNGKITIDQIIADSIEGESTNGSITLKDLRTQKVITKTENGKINLQAVEGELQAKATNGRIELDTDHMDRAIDFETVNGKLIIHTEETPKNAEIRAEVVNGSVNIFGEKNQHTIIGDGANKINLKTVNGSITVE
ncbi:DUF4097 family beta strand repeat protein [Ralstonia pickettii]|nr:DUF4097 family beta strand repeat protein [Ralstonia pickettii]